MENKNQSYVQNESVDVEERRQSQLLDESKAEHPEVNGDPSEMISGDDLQSHNEAAGMADTDSLLAQIDDKDGYPDGDEPDDDDPDDAEIKDPDDDDLDIEDPNDDDIELDDDILPGGLDEEEDDDLEDEFLNSTQHS